VHRQCSGTAGRIENSRIGTFLAYVSARGIEDRDRCRAAGVPDDVEFATKTVQARAMIARALVAEVPFAWVTADHVMGEVYARDTDLRT
jgi:SRSO17 transposase